MPKFDEKEAVAPVPKRIYNIGVRKVRSMLAARIYLYGKVTGTRYEWPNAGAIVPVDERDIPEILAKKLGGRNCCGGSPNGNVIFELV